jgi:hypothetical protein
LLAAAKFSRTIQFDETLDAIGSSYFGHNSTGYLITGTFSQSFKNCSTPLSVSGCLRS